MGVVRRTGDWRLEKRDEGLYEITYQRNLKTTVLTPEYEPGLMDGPMMDTAPVREVDTYSEAEGLFEEFAESGPQDGPGSFGRVSSSLETDLGPTGTGGIDDAFDDLVDAPPGGLALALLLVGGFFMYSSGFAVGSTITQVAAAFFAGGIAILGWAGVLLHQRGVGAAVEFLLTVEEGASADSSDDGQEKTPRLSQKKRYAITFDRADHHCEWCGDHFDNLEVHHIESRSEGGPNEPRNLIALCPNDHAKADGGAISKSQLYETVRRQSDGWDHDAFRG